ncbi:N-acetylglutamate synthase-like GNAT family acetyltransferase [Dysgonomonas alginatilytica]|uniref:N-acetylglutamate synthase-like GNAT family acetyltransferase n=1 Tax=Dysgonomonas alginatilytica TaxID=1605892 RepID=A0A2V3PQL8_9BACT|nr:GNAT family N-acetyltransferase [Dysgonomonas alginatilytica]PXV66338.1 N-acetylglutamate synthase-like GNAT family acetyltransferase [Dysgonomonas alginatilytica]
MIIRKHTDTDRKRIMELLRLNIPEYFSPKEEEDLMDYLDNHADNYYVVEADNVIVGCGGFNLSEDGETGKISWDIFDPQIQGKGYGSALTKFRIQRIKEIEGIKIISVRTSQLVYPFYEKFGLEVREIVKDYWAEGFDLYRLDSNINLI